MRMESSHRVRETILILKERSHTLQHSLSAHSKNSLHQVTVVQSHSLLALLFLFISAYSQPALLLMQAIGTTAEAQSAVIQEPFSLSHQVLSSLALQHPSVEVCLLRRIVSMHQSLSALSSNAMHNRVVESLFSLVLLLM